ncbi:DUF1643 domain-containing protein [Planococcus halotolerans]|uniref:DUF1643 domain-containing protein n=1 Tax=Planococcus halotolerans TaxID=2233542 RepID=UPI001092BF4B|nr:DUF1643 domain-containing protein [Planococcus halotolerans]QHJ71255.1 DUF1643 domain-containing protein [Planococcus halotolerans]
MFQSAKELETIFLTEGVFYRLLTNNVSHFCRSVAYIRRKGSFTDGTDALFVLLNPGKSLPVDGEDAIPFLTGEVDILPILPATPDNTMFQLMRLMERMEWNQVQIINLTDLRTGKFNEYLDGQKLMRTHRDSRHSIFSIDRYPELLDIVEGADHIIAGWGTKQEITGAAEEAYTVLSELGEVTGIPYNKQPLYYHPFPWLRTKCIKWLDDMEEQLKGATKVV